MLLTLRQDAQAKAIFAVGQANCKSLKDRGIVLPENWGDETTPLTSISVDMAAIKTTVPLHNSAAEDALSEEEYIANKTKLPGSAKKDKGI